jgi:hypothetical protein
MHRSFSRAFRLATATPEPDGTWLVGFGWPWQPVEPDQVATVHGEDNASGYTGQATAVDRRDD